MNLGKNRFAAQRSEHVAQRHVQRDMHDAQSGRPMHYFAGAEIEHHREIAHAAQLRKQFGVARIMMPGLPQSRLVQRRGDDSVDPSGQSQFDRFQQCIVSRLPAARINQAGRNVGRVVRSAFQTRHSCHPASRLACGFAIASPPSP